MLATTSLWHIKEQLSDLITYVKLPKEKPPPKGTADFFNVFSYRANDKAGADQRATL